MAATAVRHFDNSEAAASAISPVIRPGDVVLVKGSRGTRADIVTDRIVAEHG
jgi:UDP-N-acetylmuramyl pentapeptide synthase